MEIDHSLFQEVEESFTEHLTDDDNTRILFSGPFGSGKTTFLESYFRLEGVADKFDTYTLSPIDYSIYSNEDIIRYIKYDLIYKLVDKYPDSFEERYISKITAVETYLEYNYLDILINLAAFAPKYGEKASKFMLVFKENWQKIKELKEGAESYQKLASAYTGALELSEGSIYEHDAVSEMIEYLIEENREDCLKVLIIDDIDRIDPHHIFRLFNVFSAHFNLRRRSDTTKFGFHKVIFVCDEQNVRKLYHNRFGADIDYNGYIDKFFSKHIFYYDIKYALEKAIIQIVKKIKISSNDYHVVQRLDAVHNYISTFVIYTLAKAVKIDLINIRTFSKWSGSNMLVTRRNFRYSQELWIRNDQNVLLLFFDVLLNLVGSSYRVKFLLKGLAEHYPLVDYSIKEIVSDAALILRMNDHQFKNQKRFNFELDDKEYQFQVNKPFDDSQSYFASEVGEVDFSSINIYSLLLETYLKLEQENY